MIRFQLIEHFIQLESLFALVALKIFHHLLANTKSKLFMALVFGAALSYVFSADDSLTFSALLIACGVVSAPVLLNGVPVADFDMGGQGGGH